jgi:hypothetical protein
MVANFWPHSLDKKIKKFYLEKATFLDNPLRVPRGLTRAGLDRALFKHF